MGLSMAAVSMRTLPVHHRLFVVYEQRKSDRRKTTKANATKYKSSIRFYPILSANENARNP
jgi:hypothetical protein